MIILSKPPIVKAFFGFLKNSSCDNSLDNRAEIRCCPLPPHGSSALLLTDSLWFHFHESIPIYSHTGTCRDEPTHDHILLEADQIVDRTGYRGFCQHPGRLLERCSRDEAVGSERCLGDAKQDRPRCRRPATPPDDSFVFPCERESIDLLTDPRPLPCEASDARSLRYACH